MDTPNTIGFRRRHLPHWTVADRTYFVTIRLKGSIPAVVAQQLQKEHDEFLASNPDQDAWNDFQRARFLKIEAVLDAGASGPKFLNIAPVANVVAKAFDWLEQKKGWLVHARTVMPNHVHVLLRNRDGQNHRLNAHLGVFKGWTAREANKILERQGHFWMDENFDHWCRSDEKIRAAVEYIRQNPVKAGLVSSPEDWPWTVVGRPFLADPTADK
ncbi:MAG: transposase [Lentisphaerae bacterium]|nr:transposase [Lentisphaerota bacterium]